MKPLTRAFTQDYIPVRQQTTDDGLGSPMSYAAISRMVLPCGYFFALGAPFYGRTGRGGRKACRLLNPVCQPRPVPLTLLGSWVRGSFNEPEFSTMNQAPHVPICMHHSCVELAIPTGVSLKDKLEQASLWLAQSREIFRMIANDNETTIGDEIYGAITLLELAKGLVDHAEFLGNQDKEAA